MCPKETRAILCSQFGYGGSSAQHTARDAGSWKPRGVLSATVRCACVQIVQVLLMLHARIHVF